MTVGKKQIASTVSVGAETKITNLKSDILLVRPSTELEVEQAVLPKKRVVHKRLCDVSRAVCRLLKADSKKTNAWMFNCKQLLECIDFHYYLYKVEFLIRWTGVKRT